MKEIIEKIEQDIKDYVKSLDTPDNEVYQKNDLLIMSCFSKALEIIEENSLPIESDSSEDDLCKCVGGATGREVDINYERMCTTCGKYADPPKTPKVAATESKDLLEIEIDQAILKIMDDTLTVGTGDIEGIICNRFATASKIRQYFSTLSKEEDAIKFAEWINENLFYYSKEAKAWYNEGFPNLLSKHCNIWYTTTELYSIYKLNK